MLKGVLVHAGRAVPFYRRRFREAGFDPASVRSLDDLKQIPPLTKNDIRAHLDELVSETFDRSQLVARSTSGSTGAPLRLYTDRAATMHRQVAWYLADEYAGWRPGDPFAMLWGARFEVTPKQGLLGKMRDLARNVLTLNTFKLDDRMMADYHIRLSRFRPAVVLGYTASLLAMADWLERHGVRPSYPSTSIINIAQTLQPWQRERMQDVYGAPVFDRYSAQDCGVLAMDCEVHSGLHMNIVDNVLEPYGGTPGGTQEVLVTSLTAYGMPLIRYRIGDMAVFTDRTCPCGRTTPLFERVAGRVTDVIHLPGDGLLLGEFFMLLFQDLPVVDFQVMQEEDHSLTIRIVRAEQYGSREEERIRKIVLEHLHGLQMRLKYVDAIDCMRSGKFRPVISKVSTP